MQSHEIHQEVGFEGVKTTSAQRNQRRESPPIDSLLNRNERERSSAAIGSVQRVERLQCRMQSAGRTRPIGTSCGIPCDSLRQAAPSACTCFHNALERLLLRNGCRQVDTEGMRFTSRLLRTDPSRGFAGPSHTAKSKSRTAFSVVCRATSSNGIPVSSASASAT